ncbi:MAG: hypothetical protein H6709_13225 [Kofleriaceae bacterium]|nr:hypothetical protein [Kofleriaceae bacterium]
MPPLAPLRCGGCGTTAPLVDAATVACGHCGAEVAIPDDYRAPARLRAAAGRDHAAAARLWRHHDTLATLARSDVVRAGLGVLIAVETVGIAYGVVLGTIRSGYLCFVPAYLVGVVLLVRAIARATVRPIARLRPELVLEPDRSGRDEPCAVCGAPMRVPPPAFTVVTCLYCGAAHLLTSRARRRRQAAAGRATLAAGSLLVATDAVHAALAALARTIYGLAWTVLAVALGCAIVFSGC